MQYLLILVCGLLSCSKVTIQGILAKGNIKNSTDAVLVNCLVFALVSLIFSISFRNGINSRILIYAFAFGVCSASFQIFYALALKSGPFSITCLLVSLSMVIPVIFSSVYFHEELSVVKVIGVSLSLFALFLNIKSDSKKIEPMWFLYVVLAVFSTGGIGIVQKLFAKSTIQGNYDQFVFMGYLTAFLITLVLVLILKWSKKAIYFKVTKKNIFMALGIAITLGAYQFFYTFANSFVDAIILTPCTSGLTTTFQMLSGRMIFKERFTVKQICSMCVGVLAILMISL